jgi:hypothetical protein
MARPRTREKERAVRQVCREGWRRGAGGVEVGGGVAGREGPAAALGASKKWEIVDSRVHVITQIYQDYVHHICHYPFTQRWCKKSGHALRGEGDLFISYRTEHGQLGDGQKSY